MLGPQIQEPPLTDTEICIFRLRDENRKVTQTPAI